MGMWYIESFYIYVQILSYLHGDSMALSRQDCLLKVKLFLCDIYTGRKAEALTCSWGFAYWKHLRSYQAVAEENSFRNHKYFYNILALFITKL